MALSSGMLSSRMIPGLMSRGGAGIGLSFVRSVTDIHHYKQVDQSHLQLKVAESSLTRFKNKLKEREARQDQAVQREKIQTQHLQEEISPAPPPSKVKVPLYIERKPTDILKVLASGVAQDFKSPDYRYHDDSYLIPYNSIRKKEFMLAKESGKKAARFVRDHHPELFVNNLIEMDPPIKSFMPKAVVRKENASLELFDTYLAVFNLEQAVELYHVLQEKNVSLSESQKQSFLELLAYHEDAETLDEDAHLSLGVKKIKKTTMAKSVWPNCELFEAVYESIESKTPEARLALLMGYCKFGQYSKANAALESVREARDPWTTDTFNCLILCTSTKFFTHRANLYKFLQNMRAQKCSPTYETLNIITRRILSLKDSSNLPVLFSTWAEFKAAKVPLPLHAYDFLIKFLRSSNIRGDALKVIISEILDEVKGKDWTQGVRHPEDYLFFDSFITVALEQDKNLELAYKFHHEFTLFGNNQRFLDHFGVSCYYYTTLLTIILAKEPLDVAMDYYSKLVPHVFSPADPLYRNSIIPKISSQNAIHHLPRVWSDLRLSQFCAMNKGKRNALMVDLLSLCFHAAVGDDQKAVKECFVQVCMDCFTDVKNYPTNRNHPLSENQNAAKICDLVILIAIQEEQLKLAEDCLEFCTDELDTMPGQLREDTIKLYVQEMINAGYGKKALQGVLYAIQAKMANAEELGRTLANAESVALSPIEKRRLDVSFSGSMTWEALN